MVTSEPCASALAVEPPPPYTNLPIPPYTETQLSPTSSVKPLTPLPENHDQLTSSRPRIFLSLREELDEAILQPLLQLDPRRVLQILAIIEAIFAATIFIFSLLIILLSDSLYFCSTGSICEEYYGLFVGGFSFLVTGGFAFVAVCFPWCKNIPLLFSQTSKILASIYIIFLSVSIICSGHLLLLSATLKMTTTRICLITVAVFNGKI